MNHNDISVLPADGIITIPDLAKFLGITDDILIEQLSKNNIPILRLSKFRKHWLIRLEDLRKTKGGL